MTPFRAVAVPVAARLTVNRERDDASPSVQAVPTEPPASYFSCSKESELNYAAGFPVSARNRASLQRANGTEAAEFRAMELSLGRPGNSLKEGIAEPHVCFDRPISDLLTHNGTGNQTGRSTVFIWLSYPIFGRKIVTVI